MDKLKVQLSASRPGTQTKRELWVLCGVLQYKYQAINNSLREECSQQMLLQFQEQMKSTRPELKNLEGMLKGLKYTLHQVFLRERQLADLYFLLVVIMQPVPGVNNYKIITAALKVIATHTLIFSPYLVTDLTLFNRVRSLITITGNKSLCVNAQECLENVVSEVLLII